VYAKCTNYSPKLLIIKSIGTCKDKQNLHFVLELVEGITLDKLL